MLLLAVLAQTCVSWPIRADWVLEGGLKVSISDIGEIAMDSMSKLTCFFSTSESKPILKYNYEPEN